MPGYSTPDDHGRTAEESHADHEDHEAELARLAGAHAEQATGPDEQVDE